jgi:hypothetical protein
MNERLVYIEELEVWKDYRRSTTMSTTKARTQILESVKTRKIKYYNIEASYRGKKEGKFPSVGMGGFCVGARTQCLEVK